jgi:hypothetical protein
MRSSIEVPVPEKFSPQTETPTHHHSAFESAADFPGHYAETGMRVLVRHKKTGRFFCTVECWTNHTELAKDFRSGWEAMTAALALDAQNLSVFYDFGDDRYNISVPVIEPPKAAPRRLKHHLA